MDDVVDMLHRGFDFARMDIATSSMMEQVYSSLPEPPVSTATPLSSAAAERPPEDGVENAGLCAP